MDNPIAADQLKAIIERIERLEEEKKALADDIKDVYGEAKGNGFDTKIIRKIVALRKQDHAERKEQEAIMELYLEALGMALSGSAPQRAAVRRAASGSRPARSAQCLGEARDRHGPHGGSGEMVGVQVTPPALRRSRDRRVVVGLAVSPAMGLSAARVRAASHRSRRLLGGRTAPVANSAVEAGLCRTSPW